MSEPALARHVKGKGRHYEHPTTGELVPSITNIIGVLDKPAIPRWAAKLVAERAWQLRHSLEEMGEDEAVDVLKGSPWRKSGRASDRGTSIHEYLHAAAEDRDLPELEGEAKRYKRAADEFLTTYTPKFHLTEFTVFSNAGYAGTADWMATVGGRVLVGDFKTGKALYPEIALQLAAVRHANVIVDPDGNETPMPEISGCIGVLLTPKGCDVREVDTTGAYEGFLGLLAAWHWKTGTVDMTPLKTGATT